MIKLYFRYFSLLTMASCSRGGGAFGGDRGNLTQGQEGSGPSRGSVTDDKQEDEEVNWYSSPFYTGNFFSKMIKYGIN